MKSGYGYGFPILPFVGGRSGGFNPLNIRGLQLYLNSNDVTPASWLDRSINAFDFVQATATKQPSKVVNGDGSTKAVFDGVDDFQRYSAAQPLNDSTGFFSFSGYFNNSANNYYFSSGDNTTGNKYISFGILSTGELYIDFYDGVSRSVVKSTSIVLNGNYFYAYIRKNGASWEFNLNGIIELTVNIVGLNNGKWFSDVLGRNELMLGGLSRLTPIYSPDEINKIVYSNVDLTTAEIADINNFMSNPLS